MAVHIFLAVWSKDNTLPLTVPFICQQTLKFVSQLSDVCKIHFCQLWYQCKCLKQQKRSLLWVQEVIFWVVINRFQSIFFQLPMGLFSLKPLLWNMHHLFVHSHVDINLNVIWKVLRGNSLSHKHTKHKLNKEFIYLVLTFFIGGGGAFKRYTVKPFACCW